MGNIETYVKDLQVDKSGTVVTAKLQILTDRPVNDAPVTLKATVMMKTFEHDRLGVPAYKETFLISKLVINVNRNLSTQGTEIPFTVELSDLVPVGLYTDARLVLEPRIEGMTLNSEPVSIGVSLGIPTFTIQPSKQFQTIDGFGASGAWWAQNIGGMPDELARNHVADLLFSREKGIGLSQYRYNLGGGIDETIATKSRTAETFEVTQGVYDWSRDANARWLLQAAKDRGVEDFILFVNSAPRRMTISGHTYNKNKLDSNLSPAMYVQYAQYLADVWKHFRVEEGITFSEVSPLNEPEWTWDTTKQEGSPFTVNQILSVSKEIAAKFNAEEIPAKLLIPEAGDWEFLYGGGRAYVDHILKEPLLAGNVILAVHSYWSTDDKRLRAAQKMSTYPSQRVWQTEWCEMVGGEDYTIDAGLNLARTVYADLTLANAAAWQHWVAVGGGGHHDSLLASNYSKPGDQVNIKESKKLWALGNYSRFIRPGSVRLGVDSNYVHSQEVYNSAVLISAFLDNRSGKIVLVVINQAETEMSVHLSLPGAAKSIVLTPYRTSATEDLQQLAPLTFRTVAATNQAQGTTTLAPLSVTTFVTDYTGG